MDKRGMLNEEVFTYRATKDGKVLISWHGKRVTVLKGKHALKFIARIEGLEHKQAQLEMARITGNFKRGNER